MQSLRLAEADQWTGTVRVEVCYIASYIYGICSNLRLVDCTRLTVEKVDHISRKVGHSCSK